MHVGEGERDKEKLEVERKSLEGKRGRAGWMREQQVEERGNGTEKAVRRFFFLKSIKANPSACEADMRAGAVL